MRILFTSTTATTLNLRESCCKSHLNTIDSGFRLDAANYTVDWFSKNIELICQYAATWWSFRSWLHLKHRSKKVMKHHERDSKEPLSISSTSRVAGMNSIATTALRCDSSIMEICLCTTWVFEVVFFFSKSQKDWAVRSPWHYESEQNYHMNQRGSDSIQDEQRNLETCSKTIGISQAEGCWNGWVLFLLRANQTTT